MEDRHAVPYSEPLIKALENAGARVSFGNPEKLSDHISRGHLQVFATDKNRWRRPVMRDRQFLMAQPPGDQQTPVDNKVTDAMDASASASQEQSNAGRDRLNPHSIILERRVSAADRLWSAVLQFKEDLSMPVFFFTILMPSEYDSALTDARMHGVVSSITDERVSAAMNCVSAIERDRPYLGENLWSLFSCYRAFLGRLAVLITMGKQDGHVENWRTNRGTCQILTAAFGEERLQKSLGDNNDPHAIHRIRDLLESMMLKEIERISSDA